MISGRRAEELVDLHGELRKLAFERTLPPARQYFDSARAAFAGGSKTAAVTDFDWAVLVHVTTP